MQQQQDKLLLQEGLIKDLRTAVDESKQLLTTIEADARTATTAEQQHWQQKLDTASTQMNNLQLQLDNKIAELSATTTQLNDAKRNLSDINEELVQAQQQFKKTEEQQQQLLFSVNTELTLAQQQVIDTQTKLKQAQDSLKSQQTDIDAQVKAEVDKRLAVAVKQFMKYATAIDPEPSPVGSPQAPDEPQASQATKSTVTVRKDPAPDNAGLAAPVPLPMASASPAAAASATASSAPKAPAAVVSGPTFSLCQILSHIP